MTQPLDIRDIRIGDILCDRDSFPMHVVSIHHDGTVYLDFQGNEGPPFESDIINLRHVDERDAIIQHITRWANTSDDHLCLVMLCNKRHQQFNILGTDTTDSAQAVATSMTLSDNIRHLILKAVYLFRNRWTPRNGQKYYVPIPFDGRYIPQQYEWSNDEADHHYHNRCWVCKDLEQCNQLCQRLNKKAK